MRLAQLFSTALQKKKGGVGSYQSHFDTRDPEALLLNYATPSGNCIHVTSWKPFIFPIKIGPKSKSKVEFKIIQINRPCITRQTEAINPDNVTVHIEATCTLLPQTLLEFAGQTTSRCDETDHIQGIHKRTTKPITGFCSCFHNKNLSSCGPNHNFMLYSYLRCHPSMT